MKKSEITTGVYSSHFDYQQQKSLRIYFDQVVAGYEDVMNASPLPACSYDEESRPRRLGPELVHYKIDVEHAVATALDGNPQLIEQWFRHVVDGEEVSDSVVRKTARIFQARKLRPRDYYLSIRKGRPDRRSAKSSEMAA
jgi:hypothetical protein